MHVSKLVKPFWDAVGGLSAPSKMPGPAWSISAYVCNVGAVLRKIPGSACAVCYALKNRYIFANVQRALVRRLAAYNADPLAWRESMVWLIRKFCSDVFRWFDSGDIQSPEMLRDICYVARNTPDIRHWLPTREKALVIEFMRNNAIPANLCIRLSAPMVDMHPPKDAPIPTSTIHRHVAPHGYQCPAPQQGNQCRDCRACWNPSIANVSYSYH